MTAPIYRLPPFSVRSVMTALSETIDWGIKAINVPDYWKATNGKGIRVAVLDTGCQLDHPDVQNGIVLSQDFTSSPFGANDVNGHGTHCCGVIGARTNDVGMIGVAPECDLLVGKVLGDDGSGYNSWIAAGIDWAVSNGAHVVSMSLGSSAYSKALHDAVKRAVNKGVFVICAAGNSGRPDSVNYPGKHPETIAVSAVNEELQLSDFSSRGPEVDVAAPGSNITSAYPVSRYAALSGTSMACPHVAGLTALAVAVHADPPPEGSGTPLKTVEDLRAHFKKYSTDKGDAGWDEDFGWGIIDAGLLDHDGDDLPPEVLNPCEARIRGFYNSLADVTVKMFCRKG